jgi:hypothetical protein
MSTTPVFIFATDFRFPTIALVETQNAANASQSQKKNWSRVAFMPSTFWRYRWRRDEFCKMENKGCITDVSIDIDPIFVAAAITTVSQVNIFQNFKLGDHC